MALRDILVFPDAGNAGEGRFQLATNVARDHGATLSAVFLQNGHVAGSPPNLHARWLGATNEPPISGATVTYATRPDRAEQVFYDRLRSLRIEGDWKRVSRVDTNELIALAQASDLVIIGQVDPDARPAPACRPEEIVIGCGRPVLMVPYIGSGFWFPGMGRARPRGHSTMRCR
jgi:hypothetical protein